MWHIAGRGVITAPRSFKCGGIAYPAAVLRDWSNARLAQIGVHPVKMSPVDSRYERATTSQGAVSDGSWLITYATVPIPLDELKATRLREIASTAASLLGGTDWMVIREVEGYKDMPSEIKEQRSAVRDFSNQAVAGVEAVNSMAELKAYDSAERAWPTMEIG